VCVRHVVDCCGCDCERKGGELTVFLPDSPIPHNHIRSHRSTDKAEHNSESPVSIYEFTRENTRKYHTHESQVPMSMGFQGSKYRF
jgi:hypothetical protein